MSPTSTNIVLEMDSQTSADGLSTKGMTQIFNYGRMRTWWKFTNEEVIFLLDCYTNVYASVGFGQKMRGGDITVLQFFQDSVFLSDRFGIGQVTPTVDK